MQTPVSYLSMATLKALLSNAAKKTLKPTSAPCRATPDILESKVKNNRKSRAISTMLWPSQRPGDDLQDRLKMPAIELADNSQAPGSATPTKSINWYSVNMSATNFEFCRYGCRSMPVDIQI